MDILRERKEVTLRNFEGQNTVCDMDAIKAILSAAHDDDEAARELLTRYFIITPERAEMAFMPALEAYEHEARQRAAETAAMGHIINMKNFYIDAIIANANSMTTAQIVEKLQEARKE